MQARIKQREEENMDRKADKAQEHSEQLRKDREVILERIAGYHRHIDGCTAEISRYKLLHFCTDHSSSLRRL